MPTQTIADKITGNILRNVIGRDEELADLAAGVAEEDVLVRFVHGISGIGKTTLLRSLEANLTRRGIPIAFIDGRDVEPTPRGLQAALAAGLGAADPALPAVRTALVDAGRRVALIIDSYDGLGLIDTWLRQTLLPALPDNVRLVIGSRLPPGPQWTAAVEWRGLVRVQQLAPLDDAASRVLLSHLGVRPADADRIVTLSGGIPVALVLAGGAAGGASGPMPTDGSPPESALSQLANRFLDNIEEPALREAVQAACVVRRLTAPLLAAMVPGCNPEDSLSRLRAMPFCNVESDGLSLHDAVRDSVAADLHAVDPERQRRYRQAAWRQLDAERRGAGRGELWRYTADLIYLIANPIWREAFFPRGASRMSVEPARAGHAAAIHQLAMTHERPASAELDDCWLDQAPHAFHVVVDGDGDIVGFYCLCEAGAVPPPVARQDPVAAAWLAHLEARPMAGHETALFLRRWLSQGAGEAPAPQQAASWLDIKRSYLEHRPALRRVYLALEEPAPYWETAATLGFEPLAGGPVAVGDTAFHSAMLDMGPDSVDGWLSDLLAAELGLSAARLLDRSQRALRIGDSIVPLTRREYDVMAYLEDCEGSVASREDLLNDIWGRQVDASSNVVDAVVTALRRKLGDHAAAIETVRGHGYRLHGDGNRD